jgi:hypothetical protein
LIEVCRELTTSDDKDNDAAATTQACFAEVTDALNKHVSHSHEHHCENDSEVSVSTAHKDVYETHRSHDQGSALIGVVYEFQNRKDAKR